MSDPGRRSELIAILRTVHPAVLAGIDRFVAFLRALEER